MIIIYSEQSRCYGESRHTQTINNIAGEIMAEEILGIKDITKMVGCSPAVIYTALQSGELAGRNLGGRKGWISTRTSVLDWIENGNVDDGGGEDGN